MQFRVFHLLLVCGVVAIGCALLERPWRESRTEGEALSALRASGVELTYVERRSWASWGFPRVVELSLRAPDQTLTPEPFEHLGRLHALESLQLAVRGATSPETSFVRLASLERLEQLDLSHWELDDEALQSLAVLSSLRQLSISNTPVTDDGVQRLQARLPRCEIWDD